MRYSRSLSVIIVFLFLLFIIFNVKSLSENKTLDKLVSNESSAFKIQIADHYITQSLAELGADGLIPEMNDHVIMLTRVPGSGAELLVFLLQRLQGSNAFKHIRLRPGDGGILSSLQQELLVEEITSIIRQEAIPLTFDGDLRFLNFSTFGRQTPAFISLVSDPLNPRNLRTLEKISGDNFNGTIAYFCGQNPRCTKIKSQWPLDRAKKNVSRWYSVIGILEHIEETLSKLESHFPYFFYGVKRIYKAIKTKKTLLKQPVESIKVPIHIMKVLQQEIQFYLWVKNRLLNGTSGKG